MFGKHQPQFYSDNQFLLICIDYTFNVKKHCRQVNDEILADYVILPPQLLSE